MAELGIPLEEWNPKASALLDQMEAGVKRMDATISEQAARIAQLEAAVRHYEALRSAILDLQFAAVAHIARHNVHYSDLGRAVAEVSKALEALNAALEVNGG